MSIQAPFYISVWKLMFSVPGVYEGKQTDEMIFLKPEHKLYSFVVLKTGRFAQTDDEMRQQFYEAFGAGDVAEYTRKLDLRAEFTLKPGWQEPGDNIFGISAVSPLNHEIYVAWVKSPKPRNDKRFLLDALSKGMKFMSDETEQLYQELVGSEFSAVESYSSGYGSSDGYFIKESYTFQRDGKVAFTNETRISATSTPGFYYAGSNSRHGQIGEWELFEERGKAFLQLTGLSGGMRKWALTKRDGYYYFDNKAHYKSG